MSSRCLFNILKVLFRKYGFKTTIKGVKPQALLVLERLVLPSPPRVRDFSVHNRLNKQQHLELLRPLPVDSVPLALITRQLQQQPVLLVVEALLVNHNHSSSSSSRAVDSVRLDQQHSNLNSSKPEVDCSAAVAVAERLVLIQPSPLMHLEVELVSNHTEASEPCSLIDLEEPQLRLSVAEGPLGRTSSNKHNLLAVYLDPLITPLPPIARLEALVRFLRLRLPLSNMCF